MLIIPTNLLDGALMVFLTSYLCLPSIIFTNYTILQTFLFNFFGIYLDLTSVY